MMASAPQPRLVFDEDACPDCGRRHAQLPGELPHPGDDLDLDARDFDQLRRIMLEDLAARGPDRDRWSPADLDVVLVEALASSLDELSDMADRVAAEAYLETARRPSTVRWLLELIGADPVGEALRAGRLPVTAAELAAASDQAEAVELAARHLDALWYRAPHLMDEARAEGPRRIREQRRMVTVDDHAARLEDHPLVLRASAREAWHGTWPRVEVALILVGRRPLDQDGRDPGPDGTVRTLAEQLSGDQRRVTAAFHAAHRLPAPPGWEEPDAPLDAAGQADEQRRTLRSLLVPYVEALRMVGTEVVLRDAVETPVTVALSVGVGDDYFRSEVRRALQDALGSEAGLFHPAAFGFGRDVHVSDVVEATYAVAGVEDVCVNRFKRRGRRHPDRAGEGVIRLDDLEIASLGPRDSGLRLSLHGGRPG
jgi:hypothetical protein